MNKTHCALLAIAALSMFTLPGAAHAQAGTAEAKLDRLLGCQALEKDSDRLACFDKRAAEARPGSVAPTVSESASVEAGTSIEEAKEKSLPIWTRLRADRRDEDKDSPKEITVTITDVVENSAGRFYFQSEDGLIWRQVEIERVFVPDDLPAEARIKRASFGTQWLSFEGRRSTRVKRFDPE